MISDRSLEAEQSVLGGLLVDFANNADAAADLTDAHFADARHQLIWSAVERLSGANNEVDALTVGQYLGDRNTLDDAGGMAYLTLLGDEAVSLRIRPYVGVLNEKLALRAIRNGAQAILNHSEAEPNIEALADFAQQQLNALNQTQRGTTIGVQTVADSVLAEVDRRLHRPKGELLGCPTSLTDLDRITSGFRGGKLIIVAARPSMGKTAYATQILTAAAERGFDGLMVSLEMDPDEVTERVICQLSNLSSDKLKHPQDMQDADYAAMAAGVTKLKSMNISFVDGVDATVQRIRSIARQWHKRSAKPGPIVVDYLQLITTPGGANNRVSEISEVSRGLKKLALELDVPVICLSQLNRGLEQRPNKRPILADLRESGAIEQDADIVLMLYRDEVYNEDSSYRGLAEIIIRKHRNGSLGTVWAVSKLDRYQFLSASPDAVASARATQQSSYRKTAQKGAELA